MAKPIPQPFENIALALSGGGYRAAAFHLGSMSYLNHAQWKGAPLLRRLAMLSTISGGTITGVKFALCLAEEKPFDVCFRELYEYLRADQLLSRALEVLNDPAAWDRSLKQRNLINAFALVYHKDLLHEKTFGDLLDAGGDGYPEVAFNSTDIENQQPFRFQKSETGKIGHGKAEILPEAAREVRLADIVAASSCFPGGFEPLFLPGDFAASADSPLAKFWTGKPAMRLMDGGIVDNQGIDSVLLFERRKSGGGKKPFIGTFIISDVSRKMVKYPDEPAEGDSWWLRISLRQYTWAAWGVVLLAAAGIWFSTAKWLTVLASIMLTLGGLWTLLVVWLVKKFASLIRASTSQESAAFIANFNILRRVGLRYVIHQLKARIASVGRLGDVFLNRIRDLNYRSLFGDKDWNYRVRTNYIYDLKNEDALSPALKTLIDTANNMGTTLWFSDDEERSDAHMLDALIVAGQATLCHNLLEYIKSIKKNLFDDLSAESRTEIEALEAACRADFERFNVEPGWLMEELR